MSVRSRVVRIDPNAPEPELIAEAAAVLTAGGLVAFPTETVYGLGARGLHKEEVARIFVAKGRPNGHPLILHVDGEAMARTVTAEWSSLASRLATELWPGPLTLVLPRRRDVVPSEVSGGLSTVGVRAPAHAVALALIRAVGEPLAAPSANAHMHVSPTTAEHVVQSLGDRVDLLLDAGPCEHGIESTVLSLVEDPPRVLRPGAVSLERLRAIEPSIVYDAASIVIDSDVARASPGLAAKHYAPRARVVLVATELLQNAISAEYTKDPRSVIATIVVTTAGSLATKDRANHRIVLPEDPEGYAHGIFAALHSVDDLGASVVVIERVPEDSAWWAVRDRLARAATQS